MNVAEAVGRALASLGVETAFGVVGSGNFHVTNAMVAHGVRYVAARHEGGAATMADAYARLSGRVGVLTVHQGPGLTNAMTGIAEAAKSRTPLVVLAGETTERRSNFFVDQAALAEAVGARSLRVTSAETAVAETVEAFRTARDGRRTVLLNLPLDVQSRSVPAVRAPGVAGGSGPDPAPAAVGVPGTPVAAEGGSGGEADRPPAEPPGTEAARLAALLAGARRPVFVAGRGARGARRELEELAGRTGALLATSAVAKGLFRGSPWDLDVSGGFASPLAAELIRGADVLVGWGCALNMWTTRHGTLIGPDTVVVQVDLDDDALGAHRPISLGVTGDVARTARAVTGLLDDGPYAPGGGPHAADRDSGGGPGERSGLEEQFGPKERSGPEEQFGPWERPGSGERLGYRSAELARRIAAEVRWRDVPYADEGGAGRIDPRTLTIGLDDLLPAERVVSVDSGNFMGYPSMFLDVPDEEGFCFTQSFQSIGLGLATAVGAALARPDRLPVAALGDGGALMGVAELETVVRLGLPMVIVVYDDEAYGAEVHHFGPDGHPLATVTFPPADIAAIARGFGCRAVTVRDREDLAAVAGWLDGPRDRPLLVHALVSRSGGSWWLQEAFRGH
ncbi:thiamine pyrophosphate-dependent acetolactate synthase large subunit-like protein [Streptosporangium becharense]|uniref:Thiamine pyrophosphate-dependent acetolactate synthase large subunit-like protein n=1 Tax=Streptosporangium becharense TaxID=1816182 RepID=A0A7W9ICH5_9ACTN|nr:thiamine pyrophosphate-binding protein [Streptosporangium becharense]MBB2912998.1 thiamine pyrophosphate-dependent acetolactate synthase large subunit-like protein [Streptosporangium becharense]MBB5818177.1 thiamine pyrophosphate-dependent acetolactate synthase large subunit-like protein [Streptosporangium becharense]